MNNKNEKMPSLTLASLKGTIAQIVQTSMNSAIIGQILIRNMVQPHGRAALPMASNKILLNH